MPEVGDADAFIAQVAAVANGVLRESASKMLVLIKVNSWFGFKWLGFSGKAIGQVGVWRNVVTVPPFVPSRIISQRRFASPDYREVPSGPPIHLRVSGTKALRRRLSEVEPNAAFLWYSGNSDTSKRGSVMVYVPADGSYRCWYSAWSDRGTWHPERTVDISRQELHLLMESSERAGSA